MELKRSVKIGFILVFLAIIYMVPVVQTVYEAVSNEGHRIQMLDLAVDLLVTPARKARAASSSLDTLTGILGRLQAEIGPSDGPLASAGDAGKRQRAMDLCDEALIRLQLLKAGVVDYNRHLTGPHNPFAAQDTLRPYYLSLKQTQACMDTVLALVRSGGADSAAAAITAEAARWLSAARSHHGTRIGIGRYASLTLVALRRIMVGAEYLRPYEKDMEKRSVFANAVRPWHLLANYALFGDLGDKGVRGRNGWFFYRPDVEYLTKRYVLDPESRIVDPNDTPIRESIVDTIVAFKNQLAQYGVELLVAVMPGKPSIYPDMLSAAMPAEKAGTFSHSLRMMSALQAAGVETVDLFGPLVQERRNDQAAGDSVYLRTDTHFRGRGVTAVARAVAERVRRYSWYQPGDAEFEVDTVAVMRMGDVGEMTKLSAITIRSLRLSFPPESTICYQVNRVRRDDGGAVVDRTRYQDDYRRSPILVLGDSFSRIYQTDEPRSAGWIAHLARELGQPLASIVNDGGASTLVRESLARRPQVLKGKKLVIWEVVERDFRYGAEGWKNVPIKL